MITGSVNGYTPSGNL